MIISKQKKLAELSKEVSHIALQYIRARVKVHFSFKEEAITNLSLRDGQEKYVPSNEEIRIYQSFIDSIDIAVSSMRKEYQEIVRNDYLYKTDCSWWMGYYSRSIYYRNKKRALSLFMELIK